MGLLRQTTVNVFHLVRDGEPIAYALTEEALGAHRTAKGSNIRIECESAVAGVVEGEVLDWSKHGGHSFNPKLHWTCPQCDQQWWEDFVGEVDNPYFAGSGCACVAWWLVHWNAAQAANELTSHCT